MTTLKPAKLSHKQQLVLIGKKRRAKEITRVADILNAGTQIFLHKNHVCVSWTSYGGKFFSKRWQSRGGSGYPTWYRDWPGGGTSVQLLEQLVRYVQGKPVLPLSTLEWWTGPQVQLCRERGPELIAAVQQLSEPWPQYAACVLCGRLLRQSFDWWCRDKISGPCCNYNNGCRQRDPSGE